MASGEKKPPVWHEHLVSTLASSTSGIISRLICHPIDTCKARLQNPGSHFKSTWDVLRSTIREEGPRGLYRGMGTVITIGTPAFVVYLATYEATKEALLSSSALDQMQFVGHFVAGMVAETVSCLIYVPVDVIKERLQVQRQLKTGQAVSGSLPMYQGTWHALTTILKTEGVRGVYRGYGATLLSFGPYSAFYFLFYEKFKSTCRQYSGTEDLPFHLAVVSAASAGALSSWITNPLDLVRLRLQVQRGSKAAAAAAELPGLSSSAPEPYKNTWDGVRRIMRSEGVRGLFRGSLARISFHTPLTMISMSLYDECKKFYGRQLSPALS